MLSLFISDQIIANIYKVAALFDLHFVAKAKNIGPVNSCSELRSRFHPRGSFGESSLYSSTTGIVNFKNKIRGLCGD